MLIKSRLKRIWIECHFGARKVAALISRHCFAGRKPGK
jgi:hypothetical protein